MKLLTRESQAAATATRWIAQYGDRTRPLSTGETPETVLRKLQALGDSPSPEDVDKIIGNNSWTRVSCDCCQKSVQAVAQLFVENGDSTVELCLSCLRPAVALLEEAINACSNSPAAEPTKLKSPSGSPVKD